MIIGCLGDIIFSVSADFVRTLNNFQWSGNANYTTHKRANGDALVEFTGLQPDAISFDIYLSSSLGVNVTKESERIWNYEREGKTLPLVVGDKAYGKYRWVIKSHKVKMESFDKRGNPLTAKVSLSLIEYTKE